MTSRTIHEQTLALYHISKKNPHNYRMRAPNLLQAGIIHVRRSAVAIYGVEVKLVAMSALSVPVSLLLVFLRTHCQAAVLLLLVPITASFSHSLPGGSFKEV